MNNPTVLAVGNASDQLELLAFTLGDAGFTALRAGSVDEGIKIARREQPDLIISYVSALDTIGIELCRKMRADKHLRLIPFLLIGDSSEEGRIVVEGFEQETDDYITSPFNPTRLVAKAARLIERKRINDDFRESETRFPTGIENVKDVISIVAPDGTIIYESSSVENNFGYKPEELTGKNAFEFIHPEDAEKVIEHFNRVVKESAADCSIKYRFRHKNNSWRIIESVGKPFNCPDKGSVAIINSRDVSGRKEISEAGCRSENLLQAIFDNAAIGIALVDVEARPVHSNTALQKMLGYSFEELRRMSVPEFTHPDDAAKDMTLVREVFDGKRDSYQLEKRYIRKNGEVIWGHLTVSAISRQNDGARFIVGMVEDITERKQSEVALRKSEERYRNFIEQSTEGIWRIEFKEPIPVDLSVDEMIELAVRHSYYAECNDTMAQRYGFESAKDLTGKYLNELTILSKGVNGEIIRAFMEGGFRLTDAESHKIDARGESKYFLNNLAGIVDGGKLVGAWGTQRDVTSQKIADIALRESENRFQLAARATNDALWDWDLTTNAVWYSEGFYKLFGFAPEESVPDINLWYESIHPDDKKRVINRLQAEIEKGESYWADEYRLRSAAGSDAYIYDRGYAIYDENGKPLRMIGAAMNITELRRTQEQLDLFFNVSVDILCIVGFDSYFKRVNPAGERALGYTEEELLSRPFIEFVHPGDREQTLKAAERGYEGQNTISFENRYLCKDGSYKWLLWNSATIPDEQKVYAVAHDITKRKQNEATLRFQKSLLESQSEASVDGVLVVAQTGEVISCNHRFAALWKIPESVLATKSDEKFLQSVIDKLVEPEEFLETVAYLYQHPSLQDQEEIALNDGRTLERYTAPVTDADGTYYGRVWFFRDVTQRKKTEEILRESEERYRLLFDSNPLPMWVYDIESLRFLAVNDAAISHYGFSRDEFFSMTVKDIRPEEEVEAFLENVSNIAIETNKTDALKHRKKNGDVMDVEITSYELVFAGCAARLVLSNDITERKKAEGSVRFQAHLLDTVEQSVIATDLDGIVTYWNRFAGQLYGWTTAEAVGRNIAELTEPQINQEQLVEIKAQLRARKSWCGEFTVQNKNGATFPAYSCNSPINDGDGRLIGVVGVSTDITERRRAEEALRQAESRFRNLVELSPVIVYLARPFPPYAPIYVSPNIKLFGYPTEEWLTRHDMWLSVIHAEDRERVLRNTENAMKQGLDTEIEYRIVGRNGEVYWVHDKGCFISDEKGNKIGWQGVILDITETKKLQEQLRLSQKLESVGKLAGGIAHDFNNMLTAINGYSDLTLRRLGQDDPLRANIEEIKKAGERSATLTQQLLAFSRRQVLKPKVLNLNEVIIETSKMLDRLIGEHIQLDIVPCSSLGMIEADPGQLTQVIMNLAVNARDAMTQGGNLIIETANVYLDREYAEKHIPTKIGSYVLLSVSDDGIGIDEEIKQHIFEPFYTTKETGKGTGLGLATVYGIVKQSGGYIWVDSEVGKGTTFKIYLPRVDEESAPPVEAKAIETLRRGTETILLVEDEDLVRNMSRQMLEDCGYRVIEARNGIEALSVFESQNQKIDLLFTDVVMPQMGGRELAEKLAERHPRIRLLYTSGYTDDAIIRQGTITEDMNFIQKPFTFEALAKKVRELLD